MSSKARQYAEDTLGVHIALDETVELINELDSLYDDLDKAHDRRKQLEEEYADREFQLVNEMRGVHPNMTDTRFKSELKGWERTDKKLKELRNQLLEVRSSIQGDEYSADILKMRIRLGTARVEELGGYLHYLAAVADKTNKSTTQENT